MALSLSLNAQIIQVSGTVKDTEGKPVIGAAVILAGSQSHGVVTDLDGNYHITLIKDMVNGNHRNIALYQFNYFGSVKINAGQHHTVKSSVSAML